MGLADFEKYMNQLNDPNYNDIDYREKIIASYRIKQLEKNNEIQKAILEELKEIKKLLNK